MVWLIWYLVLSTIGVYFRVNQINKSKPRMKSKKERDMIFKEFKKKADQEWADKFDSSELSSILNIYNIRRASDDTISN